LSINHKARSSAALSGSERALAEKRVIGIEPTTFSLGSCEPVGTNQAESTVCVNPIVEARLPYSSSVEKTLHATGCDPVRDSDPALRVIVENWDSLPDEIRKGISSIVSGPVSVVEFDQH